MMLTVDLEELQGILEAFGITGRIVGTEELLRYDDEDPAGKDVRLIIKCRFADREPLVVKLKHEDGVTMELLTEQARFSELLADRGIPTARFLRAGDGYVTTRRLHGYDVLITVEEFRTGEITCVTPDIAEQTGALLAQTHNIAMQEDCHVRAPVLFDFFDRNDLFSHEDFLALKEDLEGEELALWEEIEAAYCRHMDALAPLRERERYAVQGDVSDCNLFVTEDGEIGLFDFNRCGDNILFCDAVMQGVFEGWLMDYDRDVTEAYSEELFLRFLRGYHRIRPLSAEEISWISPMYAVITAFWTSDLTDDHGLPALRRIADRINHTIL